MLSFGEKLRSERERRNTTLEEIAGTTKIQVSYLEALEQNEFEVLPGRNFGKLYIRAYAEVVGFDPQPLIADYDLEHARRRREARELAAAPAAVEDEPPVEVVPEQPAVVDEEQPVELPDEEPAGSKSRLVTVVLLSVGLAIVVTWIYFAVFRADRPATEPAPTPQDVIDEPSTPPAAPAVEVPEQEPAPQPVAEVAANSTRLKVADFGIGRRIVNRRLVDRGDRFEEGAVVFFSTQVIGAKPGNRIRHVWLRKGKPVQRVDLDLGGPHWRTHSRKTLWGIGPWAVEARDPQGQVLARTTFSCVARS